MIRSLFIDVSAVSLIKDGAKHEVTAGHHRSYFNQKKPKIQGLVLCFYRTQMLSGLKSAVMSLPVTLVGLTLDP